jgi:tetratricopeptide (TPR) repeat protein
MKKNKIIFVLLVVGIFIFNFIRLPSYFYNIGLDYQAKRQYKEAIENYGKVVILSKYTKFPKLVELYYNLGLSYQNLGQTNFAYQAYLKATQLNPQFADAYYQLGIMYEQYKQYNYAVYYYEKTLQANPSHDEARKKIDVLKYSGRIDSILTNKQAPQELLNLVSIESDVQPEILNKFYDVLNLLWSDSEGQKLLYIIQYNKIPLKINRGGQGNTNAEGHSQYKYTTDGFKVTRTLFSKKLVINIGEDQVIKLRNFDLSAYERVEALESVIHEICHCVRSIINDSEQDAMSEEISASIVGFNISSRIINGRDLTRQEVNAHSKALMGGLLSDSHRELPVYNNFNSEIKSIGIALPYIDVYENIVELYRSVRDYPEVQKLDTLERML